MATDRAVAVGCNDGGGGGGVVAVDVVVAVDDDDWNRDDDHASFLAAGAPQARSPALDLAPCPLASPARKHIPSRCGAPNYVSDLAWHHRAGFRCSQQADNNNGWRARSNKSGRQGALLSRRLDAAASSQRLRHERATLLARPAKRALACVARGPIK